LGDWIINLLTHRASGDWVIEGSRIDTLGSDNYETPAATFPSEAFPCPACGQMLGAACRVCVACKQPVDLGLVARPETPAALPGPQVIPPRGADVRYPWSVLLFVLVIWLFASLVAARFLSPANSQIAMASLVVLSLLWVLYDARERGVPKPLRWVLACLLLWIVFFPWYLARRQTPEASCPFIEAERGPLLRFLIVTLLVFFLLSVVLVAFKVLPPQ
jgi:hypothetical protein